MIEQLERRVEEGERRMGEARARAAAAEAAAAEKEGMLAYVGEEVERVKALFELKVRAGGWCGGGVREPLRCLVCGECSTLCCAGCAHLAALPLAPSPPPPRVQEGRLTADRDGAQRAAAELRRERDTLASLVGQLEGEARSLGSRLQEEEVSSSCLQPPLGLHSGLWGGWHVGCGTVLLVDATVFAGLVEPSGYAACLPACPPDCAGASTGCGRDGGTAPAPGGSEGGRVGARAPGGEPGAAPAAVMGLGSWLLPLWRSSLRPARPHVRRPSLPPAHPPTHLPARSPAPPCLASTAPLLMCRCCRHWRSTRRPRLPSLRSCRPCCRTCKGPVCTLEFIPPWPSVCNTPSPPRPAPGALWARQN